MEHNFVNDFINDFKEGASAKTLKYKYKLSNKRYNELKKQYKLKRENWRCIPYKNNPPKPCKNYSKTGGGGYSITKCINGKNVYFCHTNDEIKAKKIVEKLRECNWDKSEIYRILYEVEKEVEVELCK